MNFVLCCYIIIHLVVHSKQKEITKNDTIGIDSLNIESTDKYLYEAEEYGIKEMNKFYNVEEPKLFSNGLFLTDEHPAKYVAAFNRQSDEAKNLSKLAYAVLKSSKKLVEIFGNSSNAFLKNVNRKSTFGLRERCQRHTFPSCSSANIKYRTFDGSCNNFQHPWWGSAMSTMQRFIAPVYDDGIETIRRSTSGKALPSPRDVSRAIHVDKNIPSKTVTHLLMQWGQFIDHDITATAQSRGFNGTFPQCCTNRGSEFQPPHLTHPDCLPIIVDSKDDFFGKLGVRCLEFVRSGPAPKEDCAFGSREQLSQVSSYIDGSMIYSSNTAHSNSLRTFRNGLLQYGQPAGGPDDLCRRGSLATNCFRAGDARLTEQPALTSLHVVFLRLHNKIATELSAVNSHWDDEKLFQESRKIIGAIIQHITYQEYLPLVVGPDVTDTFGVKLSKNYSKGYDPAVDATVANSFSSAAYRFGHSLVQSKFDRYDKHHNLISNNVTIHGEFGNKVDLQSAGSVDRLLLGMVNQPSQHRDEFITKELTNHLFQFPGFPFGMDLAAINIQRGRDHGLAPYVAWRKICNLTDIKTWNDMKNRIPTKTIQKLRKLYENVEDVDLFTAGISEKPLLNGLVGPTFACIIAQQFSNLKKGDRFWYENTDNHQQFTMKQLLQIKRITLSKILCNTLNNIETIQSSVLLKVDKDKNPRVSCNEVDELNFNDWAERQPKSVNSTRTFPWRKPVKTNVNQKNRIVVKRPHGTNENVTIVVQNHAISSPVFITDSVYTSNVKTVPQQTSDSSIDYGSFEDNDSTSEKPLTNPTASSSSSSTTTTTTTTVQPARFNDWIANSRNPAQSVWPNLYGPIISNPPVVSTFINGQDSSRSHYIEKNVSKPLSTNNKFISVKVVEEKQQEIKNYNENIPVIQDDMKKFMTHDDSSTDELPKPILKHKL
ncbi:hypothetical protein HCN44_008429 [Aphidius gifuensis]|uniref:Peroxidase n=1 Tax=Aphidius gifuensis TaxID=684658 RepID=A0A834XQJ3_APHGI|nr:chorion peroxidase-like [Aphidius gifuensis]KAF7989755.1 hypothetical protein HCN44_008429 [Aphidius gifuensis]